MFDEWCICMKEKVGKYLWNNEARGEQWETVPGCTGHDSTKPGEICQNPAKTLSEGDNTSVGYWS